MVDTQSVDDPARDEVENQPVRIGENSRVLHPQANQRIDVEESPIRQLLAGRAPVGEAVVLPTEQLVQFVGILIQAIDLVVDRRRDVGTGCAELGKPLLQELLPAMPFGDRIGMSQHRVGQVAERTREVHEVPASRLIGCPGQ